MKGCCVIKSYMEGIIYNGVMHIYNRVMHAISTSMYGIDSAIVRVQGSKRDAPNREYVMG